MSLFIELLTKFWTKYAPILNKRLESIGLINPSQSFDSLSNHSQQIDNLHSNNHIAENIAGDYINECLAPGLYDYTFVATIFFLSILVYLGFFVSPEKVALEKGTAYECGFAPFFIREGIIEIQFIIVALLFLIFDLEVVYLVPFSIHLGTIGTNIAGVYIVYIFVAATMLAIEGIAGALSWPTWLSLRSRKPLQNKRV
jgi:NADH-quinone oxidoreductase subunit A